MRIAATTEGKIICAMRDSHFRQDAFPAEYDQFVTFDDLTNAALADDISRDTRAYTVIAGELRKADVAVQIAIEHPNTWYSRVAAAGYQHAGYDWQFPADAATQDRLNTAKSGIQEIVDAGVPTETIQIPLTDTNGVPHLVPYADWAAFRLGYTMFCFGIQSEYAQRRVAYAESGGE